MAQAGTEQATTGGQQKLQPGLKRRHMTMISLGGIIGAGLFVGTGPILLTMRMLGETAVVRPSVGSFSDYGRIALGNWVGTEEYLGGYRGREHGLQQRVSTP